MRRLRSGAGAILVAAVGASIVLASAVAVPAGAATLPPGTGFLLAITCNGSTCLAVGSNTAVVSADGGTTWGTSPIPNGSWTVVACASTASCYAAGSDTSGNNAVVASTTDGGHSWTQVYSVPGAFTGLACGGGTCVAVGTNFSSTPFTPIIAHEVGGGAWSAGTAPSGVTGLTTVACVDASHCWVGTQVSNGYEAASTANGGQSWTPETLAPPSGQTSEGYTPQSMDFIDATHGFLTGGSGGCGGPGLIGCGGIVEATTNGGATWALVEQIGNGPTERDISCTDALHCEVVGGEIAGGVIQVTADGGAHWSQQGSTNGSQSYAAVFCVNGSTCLIAGAAKSSSNGQITANPGPGGAAAPPSCTAGPASPAPTGIVTRLSGADRDATSVVVSMTTYPGGGTAKAVVLASDANYPDALAGTPLAVLKHAPLLLTPTSGLTAGVSAEIQRVAPKGSTVYILGGDVALSGTVDTQVQGLGDAPQRIAGADRFGTAVAIAGVMGDPAKILEATGVNFPDALSAGAAAARVGGAVLLTNGSAQAAATSAYLAQHPSDTRAAIGGPAATADPGAAAVAGADRYATAVDVAQSFFANPAQVGFASGVAFPDALSGGANMGVAQGPMVLVPACGSLPSSVTGYLASGKPSITAGRLFGGTSAVGDDVLAALDKDA